MFKVLEKMHTKPEHVRRRYAFGIAAGVTGFVALIWITSLSTRIAGTIVEEDAKDELKPLAAVVESVREGTEGLLNTLPRR